MIRRYSRDSHNIMKAVLVSASSCAVGVLLQGCGIGLPPTTTTTMTTTTPHSTTTTTLQAETNLWQFRNDMQMGPQLTWDLSANLQEASFYGACWAKYSPETLADGQWMQYGPVEDQFKEDGKVYGLYEGENGVTLFNERKHSEKPGCLMRKTRAPVDLSVITRIELDVTTSSSKRGVPWFSVFLAPAIVSNPNDKAKAAQIDLIESWDYSDTGPDTGLSYLRSAFGRCGVEKYTLDYCKTSNWYNTETNKVNTHITVKVEQGRIRVYRCSHQESCDGGDDYSEIDISKQPPTGTNREEWFQVWNKDIAKDRYAKYWLVADIWWTLEHSDFKLSAKNVRFFKENGEEWTMPLNDAPPAFNESSLVV